MNYNSMKRIGYAMSNAGYIEGIEDEIRLKHPKWTEEEVEKESLKVRRKATLFNAKNKKAKKPKKVKNPK